MNTADLYQTRCPSEAQWMAFYDGEGTSESRENLGKHLRDCAICQTILSEVGEQVMLMDFAFEANPPLKRRHRIERWIPVSAAAVVAVAVGLGMHTSGNRVMAALATLFQVKSIGTVPISPEQLAEISNVVTDGGHVTLNHYGSITVAGPVQSESVPLRQLPKMGIANIWPTTLGNVSQASVQTGIHVSLKLNVPHINQLIASEGGHDLFPESSNEVPVILTVPSEATIRDDAWMVKEVPQPTVAVPGSLSTAPLIKALAHLPFLPSSLQSALGQMTNWKSTLVVPLPGHPENVTIHGVAGIVESNPTRTEVGEAWVQNGTVVAVIEHRAEPINVKAFQLEVSRLFS